MTVYLAFNEPEALNDPTNAAADSFLAETGVCRSGFTTTDPGVNSTTTLDVDFTSISEGWVHCNLAKFDEVGVFDRGRAGDVLVVTDDDGNDIVNIYYPSDNNKTLEAYSILDGSGETDIIETGFNTDNGTIVTLDIHVNIASGTSGFVKIYVDGALRYDKSGDTVGSTSATGISKLKFVNAGYGAGAGYSETRTAWSQVIVSDLNTINAAVYTLTPSAGTTNEWDSGTVADVDEEGADDTDQMLTATPLDEVTFDSSVTLASLSAPEKYTALVHSYRASIDASSTVTGLTPFLQDDGSTNTYYASSPSAITSSLAGYQEIWSNDPADSNDWTAAKINGYEYGYRADN